MLKDPLDPTATVGQSFALPVLTISANFALPLSPEAETLVGAAMKVRQKASTRASKGRNLMSGEAKKLNECGINRPDYSVGSLQGEMLTYYKLLAPLNNP